MAAFAFHRVFLAAWLGAAAGMVAPMSATSAAPLIRPVIALRRAVSMQYGAGYDAQPGYGIHQPGYGEYGGQQGYDAQQNYGSQPAYGAQQNYGAQQSYGAPHNYGAQVLWRIYGVSGVVGFSGVKGFPGEKHARHWTPGGAREEDALPYTLTNGRERVLGRWNMIEQKLTVSRKQCVVEIEADGTATLTSVGKPPTLWRPLGYDWIALRHGEKTVLSDGDEISIDCINPESGLFTCRDESASQQQGFNQDYGTQQGHDQGYGAQQGYHQGYDAQPGYDQGYGAQSGYDQGYTQPGGYPQQGGY